MKKEFVSIWNVVISYKPPPGALHLFEIIYLVKYRKTGTTTWVSLHESKHLSVDIVNLHGGTTYEITVQAKYEGGKQFGPPSDPLTVTTDPRKYWYSGSYLDKLVMLTTSKLFSIQSGPKKQQKLTGLLFSIHPCIKFWRRLCMQT